MAKITKIDPKDWKRVNVVQIDVDARDNWEAIDKLEQWAFRNGFARANENFLRLIMRPDGSRVFRGVCYRITAEEKTSMGLTSRAIQRNARRISRAMKSAG